MEGYYTSDWSADAHNAYNVDGTANWSTYSSPKSDDSYGDAYDDQEPRGASSEYFDSPSPMEYQDTEYSMDYEEIAARHPIGLGHSTAISTGYYAEASQVSTDDASESVSTPPQPSPSERYCLREVPVASIPHSSAFHTAPIVPFGIQWLLPSGRMTCEAHQLVPPHFHSKYSELAPQLDFMRKLDEVENSASRLSLESSSSPRTSSDVTLPAGAAVGEGSNDLAQSRNARQPRRPLLPSTQRPKPKKAAPVAKAAAPASRPRPRSPMFIRTDPATGKVIGSRTREPKKPSLACKF